MPEELAAAIAELRRDDALDMVKTRVDKDEDPLIILDECRQGMTLVGDRFQEGTLFLAEMLLAAEIFKAVVNVLQPQLEKARPPEPVGKVILATLRGDIHDLGKNFLATLLRAQGFEVLDLGVDVEPAAVVESAKEMKPDFIGFSALITTAFAGMKEAADMLEEAHLRKGLKLLVGGGVTTPRVKEYVGADFQTTDAIEGVTYCLRQAGRRG
ncbi:B12-binding domain-containing protein [Thermodesulfobacteriota bacterium]